MFITEPLLVNDFEKSYNIKIEINRPIKRHMVFSPKVGEWDRNPWTSYFNIIKVSESVVHMYYRAYLKTLKTNYHYEYTCLLISNDGGITFRKPDLNLIDRLDPRVIDELMPTYQTMRRRRESPPPIIYEKPKIVNTRPNNIIWSDNAITHNFFVFKDKNNKLNAIGSLCASSCKCCAFGVTLLEGEDGINFVKNKIIITAKNSVKQKYLTTHYDTLNTIFWDKYRKCYWCYLRYNEKRGVRKIQYMKADDLDFSASTAELINLNNLNEDCYYTINIFNYPNSPYIVGFPSHQERDNKDTQTISMIYSKDGKNFKTVSHKWLGQSIQNPERFVPVIIESKDNKEYQIYINNVKECEVNLYLIRKDGFGHITTLNDNDDGWFITSKMIISSNEFYLNYKLLGNANLTLEFYNQSQLLYKFNNFTNEDNIKMLISLPSNLLNIELTIKFTFKNCYIYAYYYYTSSLQVIDNKDIIIDNKISKDIDTKNDIVRPRKQSKRDIDRKKLMETRLELHKQQKVNKQIKETEKETEELKEHEIINKINDHLCENRGIMEIKYKYVDLLKPDIMETRIFKFNKAIKSIDEVIYKDYNTQGGSISIYGRHALIRITYQDDMTEIVSIVKNSRSNCKITVLNI